MKAKEGRAKKTYENCSRVSQVGINLEDRVVVEGVVETPQAGTKVTLERILSVATLALFCLVIDLALILLTVSS